MEFEEIKQAKKQQVTEQFELIRHLSNTTCQPKYRCKTVLKQCNWNYDKALSTLEMKEGIK